MSAAATAIAITAPGAAPGAAGEQRDDALLLPPWRSLDDAALLAHYRGPRGVHFEPVVDADELRPERVEGVLAGRFEFNGETHTLPEPLDWLANPSADIEWHILLHKFYYAVGLSQRWQRSHDARCVRRWAQLIDSWSRATPPGFIAADVTGRRVQNWIYSLHGLVMHAPPGPAAPVDPRFFRRLLHSLHAQVEFLCANLTPKRNHRTLELLAIFLAGVVFPEFARAAHWRAFALRETLDNIGSDLLPDGVHCELSTDYHHLALRNWLQVRTLAARNGVAVPPAMDRALEQALEFSLHVHQPHGGMPSLSDGDVRGYLALLRQGAELYRRDDMRFVATLGQQGCAPAARNAHFGASGYHVLRSGWSPAQAAEAQHLVFDCGPVGEGNHGHFDALSFELAAFGRSLLVDPGRYTYSEAGATNWRLHFRSTAAHNTVCVDGRSQIRYEPRPVKQASRHAPGSMRHRMVGPAAESTLLESIDGELLDLLHGRCLSHAYDAVHERCIVFVDRRYWIVSDALRAGTRHDYALKFQLGAHAQGRALLSAEHGVRLAAPGLVIAQPQRAGQQTTLVDAWVSQRYGHKRPAPALRTSASGCDVDFDTVLVPWQAQPPAIELSDLMFHADDGATRPALRIAIALGDVTHADGWFHSRRATPAHWRFGRYEFVGRWLHWRLSADGRGIARAVSHAGAVLRGPDGPLPIAIQEQP